MKSSRLVYVLRESVSDIRQICMIISYFIGIAGFEPVHRGVKVPSLLLGYIPNDVADESRAVSHHLPQTHPHPDYIATTFLPAIGMLRRCQVHTSFSVFSLTAVLRKVRDSNPRATFLPPNDLANRPLQPLE